MAGITFDTVALPEISVPREVPTIGAGTFRERYRALERAREEAGFECLLIYADREHAANLAWLTDFGPRFEEALWVQGVGTPTLLVGNECLAYAPAQLRVEARVELYQPFSLPAQDRSINVDLEVSLRKAGLAEGMRCGVVGWKPMAGLEVPHWIVNAIADVTGAEPANANGLLMDPGNGLRVRMEPEMIRFCEYGHALVSDAMREWVHRLREGITEREAAAAFEAFGLELNCHPMVNFGERIASGIKSPRNAPARRGDYAQSAFGVIGAMSSRAGRLVGRDDPDADDYLQLVEDYLTTVRAWYAQVRVGAVGGEVYARALAAKGDSWDFALNPGHLISLDEWLASPFSEGSGVVLASGTAIQQDIIPVPRDSKAVINMEDGFVLADEALRAELEAFDPGLVDRCEARRAFMEELGYELSPDVLPLSNIPGAYFPFLLEPRYLARFA
jgi:hypothetical protein